MNVRVAAVLTAFALAACNDSSLVSIPLENNPPTAVINGGQPVYQPLDTATFDALSSTDPDGHIAAYHWQVTARPLGSNATIEELDGGRYAEFFVDLAGDFTVRLTVIDTDGLSDTETFSFSAVPYEAVHVQLTWDKDRADVDLHLTNETAGGQFYTQPWDCFFANPEPNWGASSIASDDPRLDIDDTEGFGPENINLDAPEDGSRYHVYVHYYSDDGMGATTARIRIYLTGELKWEGTKTLSGTGKVWDVARIDWPSGAIQPVGTVFNHTYGPSVAPKPSW